MHQLVRDKLDLGFMDKGEIELKNIQRVVQVFVMGGAKGDGGKATALPLPNALHRHAADPEHGDPEPGYFVDGLPGRPLNEHATPRLASLLRVLPWIQS